MSPVFPEWRCKRCGVREEDIEGDWKHFFSFYCTNDGDEDHPFVEHWCPACVGYRDDKGAT